MPLLFIVVAYKCTKCQCGAARSVMFTLGCFNIHFVCLPSHTPFSATSYLFKLSTHFTQMLHANLNVLVAYARMQVDANRVKTEANCLFQVLHFRFDWNKHRVTRLTRAPSKKLYSTVRRLANLWYVVWHSFAEIKKSPNGVINNVAILLGNEPKERTHIAHSSKWSVTSTRRDYVQVEFSWSCSSMQFYKYLRLGFENH